MPRSAVKQMWRDVAQEPVKTYHLIEAVRPS
jgi:hypothetical protein